MIHALGICHLSINEATLHQNPRPFAHVLVDRVAQERLEDADPVPLRPLLHLTYDPEGKRNL